MNTKQDTNELATIHSDAVNLLAELEALQDRTVLALSSPLLQSWGDAINELGGVTLSVDGFAGGVVRASDSLTVRGAGIGGGSWSVGSWGSYNDIRGYYLTGSIAGELLRDGAGGYCRFNLRLVVPCDTSAEIQAHAWASGSSVADNLPKRAGELVSMRLKAGYWQIFGNTERADIIADALHYDKAQHAYEAVTRATSELRKIRNK